MDNTQIVALTIAGFVLPYIHERLLGARIEGPTAIWVNFAACIAIAAAATAFSGGFTSANMHDPWLFAVALGGKAAGIFALAQLVFKSTIGKDAAPAPAPAPAPTPPTP